MTRTGSQQGETGSNNVLNLAWLAVSFWNITIAKESEPNVNEIRNMLDEDIDEVKSC